MILTLESVTDSIRQLGSALISLKLEDLPGCMDPVEGLFTFQSGPDAETFPTPDVTESLKPFTHLVYRAVFSSTEHTVSKNQNSLVRVMLPYLLELFSFSLDRKFQHAPND